MQEYYLDFDYHSTWYLIPIEKEAEFEAWIEETKLDWDQEMDPMPGMIKVPSSEKVIIQQYRMKED